MAAMKPRETASTGTRDLRLDMFRGLALWFIFLDHVPDNIVSWLTVRNYGFSDATEIFVYISGYTAVIAYSRMMAREGWLGLPREFIAVSGSSTSRTSCCSWLSSRRSPGCRSSATRRR